MKYQNLKLIISLILFSRCVLANDLIYLNGFENTRLVIGNVSGVESTGLKLQLSSSGLTETLDVDQSGRIVFSMPIPVGVDWNVTIISLPNNPNQQICALRNQSGTMSITGVKNLEVECNYPGFVWDKNNWDENAWN